MIMSFRRIYSPSINVELGTQRAFDKAEKDHATDIIELEVETTFPPPDSEFCFVSGLFSREATTKSQQDKMRLLIHLVFNQLYC